MPTMTPTGPRARAQQGTSGRGELRSRRKRAFHPDSNAAFVQAFADALRDILRDERRHGV
jgi:hypothetical protein